MKNNRIRLTESQLHRVIKESVRSILREFDSYNEIDRAWYDIDTPNSHEEDVIADWSDARSRNKDGYERGCNIDSYWDTEDGKLWKKCDMESDFARAEKHCRDKRFGTYANDRSGLYADQNLNVYPIARWLKDDQDFKGTLRTSKFYKGRLLDADGRCDLMN